MTNPPAAAARPEAWAEVRAHDQVMRYRRVGAGRAVLVLSAAGCAEPLWPELPDALAACFRVIVPDVSAADADVAARLTTFLEALGMGAVAVVAAHPFCRPALELTRFDAEQVVRVVLVRGDQDGEAGPDGVLPGEPREQAVPLLVVRRALPADEALPLVTRFLGGSGVVAPG